jgi:hypothetical protein
VTDLGTQYLVDGEPPFFERDGKPMGNVRHYNADREKFHWMADERCDLCAAYNRLTLAQAELDLVERRYWND